jgi:hypothetical protein
VDYLSSSDDSHDDFIQVWGRPTAPVPAASHSTHSIFGTDSEDNDSAKGKHHVSIGDLLAKMDPKVPKAITATTRKRKAVASDLCDTDASIASSDKKPPAKGSKPLVKPRTVPTRKRKAPAGNKKA